MKPRNDSSEEFARQLVKQLEGPGSSAAWNAFMQRCSGQLMHLARRFGDDPDAHNDCFLYLCEKLCDNRFRRLRRYRPDGAAGFRSWLNVVAANLCIDWQRSERGRRRPFRCIQSMSGLDQAVYRYRFMQRRSLGACLALLQPRFPEVDEPLLAQSVQRIHHALSPQQQWRLSNQVHQQVSLDEARLTVSGPGPEDHVMASQLQMQLQALPARQRLALKLRYRHDLPLKEIARLLRLDSPAAAHRLLHEAEASLRGLLSD